MDTKIRLFTKYDFGSKVPLSEADFVQISCGWKKRKSVKQARREGEGVRDIAVSK